MNTAEKGAVLLLKSLFGLGFAALLCSPAARSQQIQLAQPPSAVPQEPTPPATPQHAPAEPGSISGKIVDQSGANIVGALVKLGCKDEASPPQTSSDEDGLFAFSHVPPGPFCLTISAPDLVSQEVSGTLQSAQAYVTPVIVLVIPTQVTEVHVGLPPEELATIQIKEQEKQRVFGLIPNFYASYIPDAAPLRPKHKFELAWKSGSDPITLIGVGGLAGLDQAGDRWHDYGQGAQGYAKRLGATYANVFSSTFIGSAIMPSILKQDPRYFYKGTGSKRSRLLRAISASVWCKGDNGQWQPNYSNVIGSFAGSGLQVLYLPKKDRGGAGFVVSGALLRLGETSLAGVLQEFLIPKLRSHTSDPSNP